MKRTQRIVAVIAGLEAMTGLALLVSPSIVTNLLLGADALGIAIVTSRVAGSALVALGVACWPNARPPVAGGCYGGLLTYNVLAAFLLAGFGLAGGSRGMLLWPAVVIHVALAILLVLMWSNDRRAAPTPS